jgi:hypothetical protein
MGTVAAPATSEAAALRMPGAETTAPDVEYRDPAGSPVAADILASAPGAPAGVLAPPDLALPDPPDLLDPALPGERWTVLHTRPRSEKKAARACDRLGIRHYLPLDERGRRCDGRGRAARHSAALPLFPGYVFAALEPWARVLLFESGAVARLIPVPDPASLLQELRQIRAAIAAGVDLVAGPALERGRVVRVVRGKLAGVEGRVAWVTRRRVRLVLNVSLLRFGAGVEVEAGDVAIVGAPGVAEESVQYGGRRPWRVRRGRVVGGVGESLAGTV